MAPKGLLRTSKMLMLRQLAKRWRKGFSFHFFYSPCFFSWTPLQLRCKPPDLKKQELAKRYSKRADATEDLQEAMETGNKEDIEKLNM
ncbi:uncharacterized protein [Gossypium hirsutum]|uniref:Uncharacterized protein isoform X2 n=1 Tax=Gossypium hirsutum TaxID=3635 RepID=A0ABM2ZTV7_GOSHI|nr:uncharacterized protein LOC107949689 isoform X2 [Gossypium hirsutum]XP_040946073.1 uncharacterized protein LOC107949689 isoform X2 [Gossypium hirsutum]XP_040946074.1 uncharacterized protein LOC107949689 isoform X2 [Gossypium hirsutum]